jgi:hypothetical protein
MIGRPYHNGLLHSATRARKSALCGPIRMKGLEFRGASRQAGRGGMGRAHTRIHTHIHSYTHLRPVCVFAGPIPPRRRTRGSEQRGLIRARYIYIYIYIYISIYIYIYIYIVSDSSAAVLESPSEPRRGVSGAAERSCASDKAGGGSEGDSEVPEVIAPHLSAPQIHRTFSL